ncbi:D(1B) dopamine receptor, partial [Biomphalaria glabrata]
MNETFMTLDYPFHDIVAVSYIFTLVVNVIMLIIVLRHKELRQRSNTFIIVQVGSDILFPFILMTIHFCQSSLSFDALFNFIGILELNINYTSIVLISINRYVLLTNPYLHERLLTKRNVAVVIVVTWFVSFLVSCPFCECNSFEHSFSQYSFFLHYYVFPVLHCLCLLVIVVIHTHICIIASRHVNAIASQNVM